MSLSPGLSQPHSLVVVATYGYFIRHGAKDLFPAEWAVGLEKLDQALSFLYASHKREGLPTRVFWMLHRDVCAVFLNPEASPRSTPSTRL